ncbi:MAG: Carboxylesterase [Gammaproteobacteria bacterium]|jgi:phospholipase/carboxylesterase|nr:Carboxylesterase [Gammaproteobacteria bacterium]
MNTTILLNTLVHEPVQTAAACVIWLHGLGADGHDFKSLPNELRLSKQHNIRFVFPHAPMRPITLNGGLQMRGWYDILGLAHDSSQDHAGIQEAYAQCSALIEKQAASGIPYDKIILGGFSQGAALALYTGLRYPHALGGIVSLSGYLPLAENTQAEASLHNKHIPIFMAQGTEDPIVSFYLATISYQHLYHLSYPIKWHTYPMGHHICTEEMKDLRTWLMSVLQMTDNIL